MHLSRRTKTLRRAKSTSQENPSTPLNSKEASRADHLLATRPSLSAIIAKSPQTPLSLSKLRNHPLKTLNQASIALLLYSELKDPRKYEDRPVVAFFAKCKLQLNIQVKDAVDSVYAVVQSDMSSPTTTS